MKLKSRELNQKERLSLLDKLNNAPIDLPVFRVGEPLDGILTSSRNSDGSSSINQTIYSSITNEYQSHRVYLMRNLKSEKECLLEFYGTPISVNLDIESSLPMTKIASKKLELDFEKYSNKYNLERINPKKKKITFKEDKKINRIDNLGTFKRTA